MIRIVAKTITYAENVSCLRMLRTERFLKLRFGQPYLPGPAAAHKLISYNMSE
jgi:hypothetical protein